MEAKATQIDDSSVVVDFVRIHIFCRFGVPMLSSVTRALIFCNQSMDVLLKKYGVLHNVATTYHSQTNRQAKVSNREIKQIPKKNSELQ